MLFDDEHPEEGAAARDSVVSPAQRSVSAEEKAVSKRTDDDLPVHSFRSLLQDLGTLTRNRCIQPAVGADHPVHILSEPTPVQEKAFRLLGVAPMV